MSVDPSATKRNVLEQLLEQGMVLVALDARIEGVKVPDRLGHDAQLRLNLSYRFGLPMELNDWGISATLTFSGKPFNCLFPWSSVFLFVSHVTGQPYLFPEDIPAELLSQATAEAGLDAQIFTSQSTAIETPKKAKPKLKLVTNDASETAAPEAPRTPTTAEPPAALPQPHAATAKSTKRHRTSGVHKKPVATAVQTPKSTETPTVDSKSDATSTSSDPNDPKTPPPSNRPRRASHLRVVK